MSHFIRERERERHTQQHNEQMSEICHYILIGDSHETSKSGSFTRAIVSNYLMIEFRVVQLMPCDKSINLLSRLGSCFRLRLEREREIIRKKFSSNKERVSLKRVISRKKDSRRYLSHIATKKTHVIDYHKTREEA
jgi:alpha-tubulin suppressor-like RCC1 family protein